MAEKNKYTVHLFTEVRLKVAGIQAESMEQAIEQADNLNHRFHDILDSHPVEDFGNGIRIKEVEWTESCPNFFCVDQIADGGEDTDYEASCWFGPDSLPLIDGRTTVEQKAHNADLSAKFMKELLDSVETLTGIAEVHGVRTLADLMYLNQAILKDGYIDYDPESESTVLEIVRELPSSDQWAKYIEIDQNVHKASPPMM